MNFFYKQAAPCEGRWVGLDFIYQKLTGLGKLAIKHQNLQLIIINYYYKTPLAPVD